MPLTGPWQLGQEGCAKVRWTQGWVSHSRPPLVIWSYFTYALRKGFSPWGRGPEVEQNWTFIHLFTQQTLVNVPTVPESVLGTAAATKRNRAESLSLSSARSSEGVENKPCQQTVPAQLWWRQSRMTMGAQKRVGT